MKVGFIGIGKLGKDAAEDSKKQLEAAGGKVSLT